MKVERKTEKFQDQLKKCMQDEPPFCNAACPFHLNIKEFIHKIKRGGFNSAYRTYLNSVGFPVIVSELCHEPCKDVCPRKTVDDSINIKMLEKASIKYARNLVPNNYNLPKKDKRIAIIGAGISGLGCALRLSSKKYEVTVFEKTGRIGGNLWNLMDSELFLDDINRQFMYEEYSLQLNTEITDLDSLDYDAVYVATGKNGNNLGLGRSYEGAYASSKKGIFLGGELEGRNTIEALADGLNAAKAIERYLKTGNMNEEELSSETKIKIDTELIVPAKAVIAMNERYTEDEAVEESKRCLLCSCDACIQNCDLMKYYHKFPKRIGEEVHITINPGTLDGNGTVATRLISTCNQCGLCKEVCPVDIDTGEFLLQSHYAMRKKDSMPWAFHEFWLKDMEFTNGDKARICKLPEGCSRSRYAYFPGCQLGASDPDYVIESYRYLLEHNPDTALLLRCCGAPADWAGDEAIHEKAIQGIKENWSKIGKPKIIFSCTSCRQMFDKYLPGIEGVFIYELMSEWGIDVKQNVKDKIISVFDPCTGRHESKLQKSVRELAKQAKYKLKPLPFEGKNARCCSWGGQVSIANPPYAKEVVKARISQGDKPYLAYCANCRDIFAKAGKPTYHIFDILFNLNDSSRPSPTFTQRRKNRILLKNELLKRFWNYDIALEESKIKLYISSELKDKINNENMLEEDLEAIIEHCENTGRKLLDPKSGHFIGHMKVDNMTFWLEYAPMDDGFKVYNAYGHRMSIVEE